MNEQISCAEAAARAEVSRETIRRRIKTPGFGERLAKRVGRAFRVDAAVLDEVIAGRLLLPRYAAKSGEEEAQRRLTPSPK